MINLKSQGQLKVKIIATTLLLILFILLMGTIQETLGKYTRSFVFTDSALVAKFDVSITTPEEFWPNQGEYILEYHFLSAIDIRSFTFQIHNNGEAEIICIPYINDNILYRVFISGVESPEFFVKPKETVEFQLLMAPDGLDENIREAELIVDIRQVEGR